MNKHLTGFTLVELLVVISIISVLSSVVLASFNSARTKGINARIQQEVLQLRNELEQNRVGDTYNASLPASAYLAGPIVAIDPFSNTKIQSIVNDILSKNGGMYGGGVIGDSLILGSCVSPYYGVIVYSANNPVTGKSSRISNGLTIYLNVTGYCGTVTGYAIYAAKKPISLTGVGLMDPLEYSGYYCVDSKGNSKSTNSGWLPDGNVNATCS